MPLLRLFLFQVCALGFLMLPGLHAEDVRHPASSGVLNIRSAPCNAVGDGFADDTAATGARIYILGRPTF